MSTTLREPAVQPTLETTNRKCDYCSRTDTEPAILEIHDDEGTLVEHWDVSVCPEHVAYLVQVVQSGERT